MSEQRSSAEIAAELCDGLPYRQMLNIEERITAALEAERSRARAEREAIERELETRGDLWKEKFNGARVDVAQLVEALLECDWMLYGKPHKTNNDIHKLVIAALAKHSRVETAEDARR